MDLVADPADRSGIRSLVSSALVWAGDTGAGGLKLMLVEGDALSSAVSHAALVLGGIRAPGGAPVVINWRSGPSVDIGNWYVTRLFTEGQLG